MIPVPDKPCWEGPYPGSTPRENKRRGVTQSLLIRFMECPFRFYLYAYCGYKELEPPHENLIWGSMLHKGLEHLIRGDSLAESIQAIYDLYQSDYPTSPEENLYTCYEMLKLYPLDKFQHWTNPITEYKLEHTLTLPSNRTVLIRGMADVTDFTRLCDHKCKGRIYPQETAEELGHDLQMNLYTSVLKTYEWQYDLIMCPLGAYRRPEKRGLETAQHYAQRLFYEHKDYNYGWPISQHLYNWICCIPFQTTQEQNDFYFQTTIAPWIDRLCEFWDTVTDPSFDPNKPEHHSTVFYRNPARVFDPSRTDKFKPHFHSLLINKDTVDSLVKVNSFYEELDEPD